MIDFITEVCNLLFHCIHRKFSTWTSKFYLDSDNVCTCIVVTSILLFHQTYHVSLAGYSYDSTCI